MFNSIQTELVDSYYKDNKAITPWYHFHNWLKEKTTYGANFYGTKMTCKKCNSIKYR